MSVTSNTTAPPTRRSSTSQIGPDRNAARMNATNQITSPIRPSPRTTNEARPNSKSLRATVPEGIVAFLDLKARDRLEWSMDFEDGRKVVKVRKARV